MHFLPPATSSSARARTSVLALLAVAAAACGGAEGKRPPTGPPAVPVSVTQAERRAMPVTFRAIGQVEAIANVAVRSRASGELQKVHFTEGEHVKAGDILFTIDPRPAQAALAQAQAQLARDQAQLAQAEADVARYTRLVEQDYITRQQYDQARTLVATTRAAIAGDQAAIDNARLQLAYSTITAPVSGRTGALQVRQGNLVQANDGRVLVTINQTRPIYATFSVPAQYLPSVLARRGERIVVTAKGSDPDAPVARGVLTFVDNAVDASTSTITLKATFANDDERLWPGLFVDVMVTLGTEADRVVVPATAVQTGQIGTYLYVVSADQTAELRKVEVARIDAASAVISSGLSGGETVVTDGQLRLVDGAKVQIKPSVGDGGKAS